MIITKITTQKHKGFYNIFIDDKYDFSVTEGTLIRFSLAKGQELSKIEIDQIKESDEISRAQNKAINFLSYQIRSTKEVRDKLLEDDISPETIETIVDNLKDLNYLDDQKYASLFIQNDLRVGHDGPTKLREKLRQKGISDDLIASEIEKIDPEEFVTLADGLLRPLEKQTERYSVNELKQKMRMKLMMHGFSNATIEESINKIDFPEENSHELIVRQGIKAFKKYKKFDDYTRNQKIYRYLMTHGFKSDEIKSFLAEEFITFEEIAQY